MMGAAGTLEVLMLKLLSLREAGPTVLFCNYLHNLV
jgi:hypothetical protein